MILKKIVKGIMLYRFILYKEYYWLNYGIFYRLINKLYFCIRVGME